jgi:16S rRNA processing protein RimM
MNHETIKIKIGKVIGAVGIRGEIKIFHDSGESERLADVETLWLGARRYAVASYRLMKKIPIFKLEGLDDRNEAEALAGAEVFVAESDVPALEEGRFYVRDLIGLTVIDEALGVLGTVTEIIDNPANDILEVAPTGGAAPILIPLVDQFVIEADVVHGTIKVRIPEGLAPQ